MTPTTHDHNFIDGGFRPTTGTEVFDVVDPTTGQPSARVVGASNADIADAVASAKRAQRVLWNSSKDERLAMLNRMLVAYDAHTDELTAAVAEEIGLPEVYARDTQVAAARTHLVQAIAALENFAFDQVVGHTLVRQSPIGVTAQITPWNWPLTQIVLKVAPALAAGCASVLKPSEYTPRQSDLFAKIAQESDLPAGAFTMVNGLGPTVGAALVEHPDIAMVSFTGSTRAGKDVAARAASMVKRVALELGGKSPAIVLDEASLPSAADTIIAGCFDNNGQSCDAPTRMLVPRALMDQAVDAAVAAAESHVVGDPRTDPAITLGPVINERQYQHVQRLIETAIAEGTTLACGGPGRPEGLDQGWFIRPTVFADVAPTDTISTDEVFGPVLAVIGYDTVEEAIDIANDTSYGLAGYVFGEHEHAVAVAGQLDVGQVQLNAPEWAPDVPFGGRKQSGYGREGALWGLEEFLEPIALIGAVR